MTLAGALLGVAAGSIVVAAIAGAAGTVGLGDPRALAAHRLDAVRAPRRGDRRDARPRGGDADARRRDRPTARPATRRRGARCGGGDRGRPQPRGARPRGGLGRQHRAPADPPGARLLRGRRRPRADPRAGDAHGRAGDARPVADASTRRARARAGAVADGRQLRVHHGRAGSGALRSRAIARRSRRAPPTRPAFAVPLDYTIGEGSKLVLPLDAAPLSAYPGHAYGGGARERDDAGPRRGGAVAHGARPAA